MRRIEWYQNRSIWITGSQVIYNRMLHEIGRGIVVDKGIVAEFAITCDLSVQSKRFLYHSNRLIETIRMS